jgi:hypothetical protein
MSRGEEQDATCTLEGNIKMNIKMGIGLFYDGDEPPGLRVLHPNRMKLYGPPAIAVACVDTYCPVLTSTGVRTSPLHYENGSELRVAG